MEFSKEFGVDKMRSGIAAVYQLKEQFEKFSASPQKVDVCDSIARCFFQLEQYEDAASWYETAGRLILSDPTTALPLKAMSALAEYESALECYKKQQDDEKASECSSVVKGLRRSCAPN
jgi:tetratricopeptide (TPR) repeat protein